MVRLSPGDTASSTVWLPTEWLPTTEKFFNLVLPILTYWAPFDALTILPILGFIFTCIVLRRARVSLPALVSFICLLARYAVLPVGMNGVFWIDTRLTFIMALIFFAGVMPVGLSLRSQSIVAALFAVLFVLRIIFVTEVWLRSQQDVADVRDVITAITPGSRVLVVENVVFPIQTSRRISHFNRTYWHLAAFVLLDRRAFWSNMFMSSNQPVEATEAYRDASNGYHPPANYLDLGVQQLSQETAGRYPNLIDWNHKYDYVLLLNADNVPNVPGFLHGQLEFLGQRGIAALFSVER